MLGFREVEDRLAITAVPWERRERSPRPPAGLPAEVGGERPARVQTEDVVESAEEGVEYVPPVAPPGEEER